MSIAVKILRGDSCLFSGLSEEEILDEHPILEREDIKAALLYASQKLKKTITIHAI